MSVGEKRRFSCDWTIGFESGRFDFDRVHGWLSERAYWAMGRPRAVFDMAVRNSLCVGAFASDGAQIGFARVVTDYALFAWIADVFVEETFRGQGVSKGMLDAIMARPELAMIKRFMLVTSDAHGLYSQYGFAEVEPGRFMQLMRASTPP